jgi:predicted alpha/beta superfamily hydrolase
MSTQPPTSFPLATISQSEVRLLKSSFIDQVYQISIALPDNYAKLEKHYPVVYMLDSNGMFGMVTEIARFLRLMTETPELLLVGIGYPVSNFDDTLAIRTRDYTPSVSQKDYEIIRSAFPVAPPYAGSGEAPKFFQFITENLMPMIDSSYRTLPKSNILLGDSLAGLFCLYSLFRQPEVFKTYVVGSPSIWWDNNLILKIENEYASKHKNLVANVLMYVGLDEDPTSISDFYKLNGSLQGRKYESLNLVTHGFENETHVSVIPAFVSRGLREAFAPKG